MVSPRRKKACWACRNSKVRCDLSSLACSNCIKSGKQCQYGLRLSWPREGDARRSIVSHHRAMTFWPKNTTTVHHVNIGFEDLEIFYADSLKISRIHRDQMHTLCDLMSKSIPRSMSWIPPSPTKLDPVLLSYYEVVLAKTVSSSDDTRFHGLLISMSFIDTSPNSVAVQLALYALAALYLWGPSRAIQFKKKATSAFYHAHPFCQSYKDGLQFIAAGLLLTLYEMFDYSNSSYRWEAFAGPAKCVAKEVYALDKVYEGDSKLILDWIFYHDALSTFSGRHWGNCPKLRECSQDDQIRRAVMQSGNTSKIINTAGASAEVLETIGRICSHVLEYDDPTCNSPEHVEALNRLERKLIHAEQYICRERESEPSVEDEHSKKVAEIYRLAALIYLYRAGRRYASNKTVVSRAVKAGIEILASLQTCTRAFPLVILGCEAHCDEDRLAILDLLRRTQEHHKIGNIVMTQRVIEASWAQDDIHADIEELDYVKKFDAIMSLGEQPPSFT